MRFQFKQKASLKGIVIAMTAISIASSYSGISAAAWKAPEPVYKNVPYGSEEVEAYFNEDNSITLKGKTSGGERYVNVTFWYDYAYEVTGDPFGTDVTVEGVIGPDGSFSIQSGVLDDYPSYNVSFSAGGEYYYHDSFTVHRRSIDQPKLLEGKTKSSIKEAYAALKPTMFKDPFIEEYRAESPYRAGRLSPAFLNDGLRMVHFVRYLAGLPTTTVALHDGRVESAQHKAVLLEANYDPSDPHHPPKPADMEQIFYETANPGWETLAFSTWNLSTAVEMFMNDWGDNNRERVGHRDSFLTAELSGVGFGYTPSYTITHFSMDGEQPSVDYQYIAWPSVGYFPVEFMPYEMWSIHPNNNKYDLSNEAKIRLTVTNLTSGETQTFSNPNGSLDNDFFVNSVITFEPVGIRKEAGDTIHIKVTGIKDLNGNESEIHYATKLFSLSEMTVLYNGQELTFPKPPYVDNGTTVVPMRSLFEALEAEVEWDGETGTITARSGGKTIHLVENKAYARVNGKEVRLGSPVKIIDGTTFIPLRFVGESLGATVGVDMETMVITVSK